MASQLVHPAVRIAPCQQMAARLDAMGVSKYKGLTRKSGDRVWTGRIRLDQNALAASKPEEGLATDT